MPKISSRTETDSKNRNTSATSTAEKLKARFAGTKHSSRLHTIDLKSMPGRRRQTSSNLPLQRLRTSKQTPGRLPRRLLRRAHRPHQMHRALATRDGRIRLLVPTLGRKQVLAQIHLTVCP